MGIAMAKVLNFNKLYYWVNNKNETENKKVDLIQLVGLKTRWHNT